MFGKEIELLTVSFSLGDSESLSQPFLDVTQRSPKETFGGALRDIQKTAAKETGRSSSSLNFFS